MKWLRRIELADRPFMTREETSRHRSDGRRHGAHLQLPHGRAIAHHLPVLPGEAHPRLARINGIAWTGSGRITRVDVSTDGGGTWTPAKLQEPVLPKAHTRFRYLWNWTGGDAVIMSRAVDETGYMQPTRETLIASRGISSVGYHTNPITGWQIRSDGAVTYHAEPWT